MHTGHRRSLSALLLLTAFVVGGLLAPSVHRLQHVQELVRQQAAEAVHCRHHAHDRPGVEADAPVIDGLVCPPYHSLFSGIQLVAPVSVRVRAVPSVHPHLTSYLFSVVPTHRFIRGPPLAA